MSDWSRVANTTIHQYIREQEVNILRNRKLLALLQSRGRISFNHSGDLMDWKVKYKRAPIQGYADMDVLSFSRRDRWKTAQLEWRGYYTSDSITKLEREKNKNTEAIVKVFSEMAENLMKDIEEQFGDELYVDGNATGNSKRLHGLKSFLGYSGAAAAGYIASPSDTYAGLTTGLGDYGGAWAQNGSSQVTWPIGTGDDHYDFWSPLIVDYTDTLWTASTDTWANTCQEALRFGILHSQKNKSLRGMMDMIVLDRELYRQFLTSLQSEERLVVSRGSGQGLVALGFKDVVNWDGVDITTEYGTPSGEGYGICVDAMELRSLQGQLFVPEGPDYRMEDQTYRLSLDMMGNARFNPRNFVFWKNVT